MATPHNHSALVILTSWDIEAHGTTTEPTRFTIKHLRERTLQFQRVSHLYCTVLDNVVSEEQQKDAEKAGVTLIPASKNKWLDPHEDPKGVHWLVNFNVYYPLLEQLKDIKYVVGYIPKTRNAATAIYRQLFPHAQFHLIHSPAAALFVNDDWDSNNSGLTGFHSTIIQEFRARKAKVKQAVRVYATIAHTEVSDKQRRDAENCGVILIPAKRKGRSKPAEDQPELKWLLNHEIYFPDLKKLDNIKHVVGYAPKTALAAADIREKVFKDAELVMINHAYENKNCLWENDTEIFGDNMLKVASEANIIFSLGPKMYDYFINEYRAKFEERELSTIPHSEIFPKPKNIFFQRDPVLPESETATHCILTYGQLDTAEAFRRCDEELAASVGILANRRKEFHNMPPEWLIHGVSPSVQKEGKESIKDKILRAHVQTKFKQDSSVTVLLRALHQSHLCLPASCFTDYGFCGLEAVATGIPTFPAEDSELGWLISKYFPSYADICVIKNDLGLTEKITQVSKDIKSAFFSAKKLKQALRDCRDVDKSYATFVSLLTPKKTELKNDHENKEDSQSIQTIGVHVVFRDDVYQQQQHNVDDAWQQMVESTWNECMNALKREAEQTVCHEASTNKVSMVCSDQFGNGARVIGMSVKSLAILVDIPGIANLYQLERSCNSGSFSEALEPILITDDMRGKAARVGLSLKLIATYDQARFDELELFFQNARDPRTTIQVSVQLDDDVYQRHLQGNMNGANQQTVETIWNNCKEAMKTKVSEIVSSDDRTQKVRKTCASELGDDMITTVTGVANDLLQVSVYIPRLAALYRLEGCCQSSSFSEALKPMLVPEQMRKQADRAGVPLKLTGTYDQAKFDELELIFIDRDGGGIQPVEAHGNAEEEDHVEDLQIYEPTVNLHGGEETTVVDTDMTYQTGKSYTLLLEMDENLEIKRSLEKHAPVILNSKKYITRRAHQTDYVLLTMEMTDRVQHILSSKSEILELLGVKRYLVTKSDRADLRDSALREEISRHGHVPNLSIATGTHSISLQARSLLPFETCKKEYSKFDIRYHLQLAQGGSLPWSSETKMSKLQQKLAVAMQENSSILQSNKILMEKEADAQQKNSMLERQRETQSQELKRAEELHAKQQLQLKDKDKEIANLKSTLLNLHVSDNKSDEDLQKQIARSLEENKSKMKAWEDKWTPKTLQSRSNLQPGQKAKDIRGLAFNNYGQLAVCDHANSTVQILNQAYTCDKVLRSTKGQFAKAFKPVSVAISHDNLYFVLDDNNLHIVVYDQSDKIVKIIPLPVGSKPNCIALVKRFVLVAEVKGHRILKYTQDGKYISEVGGRGHDQTTFIEPSFVAVNSKDEILVLDKGNQCVKCFDIEFNYLYQYGSSNDGKGKLPVYGSIAVDGDDNVYVGDWYNCRIEKWGSNGKWICNLLESERIRPLYIAITTAGDRIAIRGYPNDMIKVFSK